MTTEHVHDWYVACHGCHDHPDVSGHYVTFSEGNWVIEHSLGCRLSGEMEKGCTFQASINALFADYADAGDDFDKLGRWEITAIDEEGLPSLRKMP